MTRAWWRRARSATLASATSAVPVRPHSEPAVRASSRSRSCTSRSPDLTSRARHACQVPSRQICPIAPDGRRSDPPYSAASSMTRRTRRSSRSKATTRRRPRTSGALQPDGVPCPCIFFFLRCSRPVLGPHFGEEPGQVLAPGRHRDRVCRLQPAPATRRGSAHPPHHDRLGGLPRPEEARRTPFHRAGSRRQPGIAGDGARRGPVTRCEHGGDAVDMTVEL